MAHHYRRPTDRPKSEPILLQLTEFDVVASAKMADARQRPRHGKHQGKSMTFDPELESCMQESQVKTLAKLGLTKKVSCGLLATLLHHHIYQ